MNSLNEILIRAQDFVIDESFIKLDELIDLLHTVTDRADKMSVIQDIYTVYDFIVIATKKRDKILNGGF